MNAEKYSLNKWHMVLNSNHTIDNTLNLPNTDHCGGGQHLEVWISMKSPKSLVIKDSSQVLY